MATRNALGFMIVPGQNAFADLLGIFIIAALPIKIAAVAPGAAAIPKEISAKLLAALSLVPHGFVALFIATTFAVIIMTMSLEQFFWRIDSDRKGGSAERESNGEVRNLHFEQNL